MKNFRSFLSNKKRFIISALAGAFIIAALFACAKLGVELYKKHMRDYYDNYISLAAEDESSPESTEIILPTEFKPYLCDADAYYSFSASDRNVQNQYGYDFELLHIYEDHKYVIVYSFNWEQTKLFEIDEDSVLIHICAYIDNSLYFYTTNDADFTSVLYRIELDYDDEGCIIQSNLEFVLRDVYYPVKVEKNNLIIISASDGYVSLDTKTGAVEPVEYNNEIDAAAVSNISVSADDAINIAFKELTKNEFSSENYTVAYEELKPVLIHNPDIVNYSCDYLYEDYPEYAWRIIFNNDAYTKSVYIYVNAQSGKVSLVYPFNWD